MRANHRIALMLVACLCAPALASAQLDCIPFVGLPSVGAWAEYIVTNANSATRTVTSQTVSLLSTQTVDDQEYLWFQIETESDDFGSERRTVVTQMALSRADAEKGGDLMRNVRELIFQVEGMQGVRVASDFVDLLVKKGLIAGGTGGAGTSVVYDFRDHEPTSVATKAGEFEAQHKKGIGQAEIILNLNDPKRQPVDSIQDLWFDADVPFGLIRQVTKISGGEGKSGVDSEHTVELVAFGTGAVSAIRGEVREYSEFVKAASAQQP